MKKTHAVGVGLFHSHFALGLEPAIADLLQQRCKIAGSSARALAEACFEKARSRAIKPVERPEAYAKASLPSTKEGFYF